MFCYGIHSPAIGSVNNRVLSEENGADTETAEINSITQDVRQLLTKVISLVSAHLQRGLGKHMYSGKNCYLEKHVYSGKNCYLEIIRLGK